METTVTSIAERKHDLDVYIGRPGKWGNPFHIGQKHQGRVLTRELAIEAHRDWLLRSDKGRKLLEDIGELKGKRLVCWCSPQPCHGDILARLANGEEA